MTRSTTTRQPRGSARARGMRRIRGTRRGLGRLLRDAARLPARAGGGPHALPSPERRLPPVLRGEPLPHGSCTAATRSYVSSSWGCPHSTLRPAVPPGVLAEGASHLLGRARLRRRDRRGGREQQTPAQRWNLGDRRPPGFRGRPERGGTKVRPVVPPPGVDDRGRRPTRRQHAHGLQRPQKVACAVEEPDDPNSFGACVAGNGSPEVSAQARGARAWIELGEVRASRGDATDYESQADEPAPSARPFAAFAAGGAKEVFSRGPGCSIWDAWWKGSS